MGINTRMDTNNNMGVRKIYYSWDDINTALDIIHLKTKKRKFRFVTGIPRGGTILAILYSHRFGLTYLERMSPHYPDLLVLDDIADSGVTIEKVRRDNPVIKNNVATVHYKRSSTERPDFYAEAIEDDFGWIVYPWEKEDSKPIQDYLDNKK